MKSVASALATTQVRKFEKRTRLKMEAVGSDRGVQLRYRRARR